ncbi:MAG: TolC family protein [Paracoccaceae bacterium]
MSRSVKTAVGPWAAALLLAGCVAGTQPAAKQGFDPTERPSAEGSLAPQGEQQSALIADLQARRSVLPSDGPFATVADSVIEASAGASVAQLRVARLKEQAKAKNWLPQIGPSVNLTSLSGLATSLLLEQALFDNGRRKAERAYAAADVELAAIALSEEMNERVYQGLSHYVRAEQARAQAAVSTQAVEKLTEFDAIITARMEGGLSDRSEQQVIRQALTEMQATRSGDREAEISASAELNALAAEPMDGVRGLNSLPSDSADVEPLSVVKARAEGAQLVAEANVQRSEMLPGIRASAGLGGGGLEPGIRLGGGALNGGMRANMDALKATGEVAGRQTAQADEDARRRIVMLERQIATLQAREAEGATVLAQTSENVDLFTEQYKVGRRSLLELVNQYDAKARLERDQASLPHEVMLLRLQIARDRGQLVDGARM